MSDQKSTLRRRDKPLTGRVSSNGANSSQSAQLQPSTDTARFEPHPIIVFSILFAAHTLGAVFHPIQDCDETFNYWEPTHYLMHRNGFQTWEYSPDYAIRSWAYSSLHALMGIPGRLTGSKVVEFYSIRIILGLLCALSGTRLCLKAASVLNPRIAIMFIMILATSPGMFHASISYLPSSFSMYTTMMSMAAFMDWRGGIRTAEGIFWCGAGACLGWPFAAAMAIPFLLEEVAIAGISDKASQIECFWRFVDGIVRVLIILALQVAVDVFFYKKLVCVPFNIVWYNVFSGKGGPDLYGTDPWHFYLRNLFLNFHIWFLLALISIPLLLIQHFAKAKGTTRSNYLRGVVFLAPFYLWLAIFSAQPHKEERFMYPAYPALALNAAVALHIILANLGTTDRKGIVSMVPVQLRFLVILGFVLSALALSAFRTVGTITAYNAPLSLYQPLHKLDIKKPTSTVCLGKEWYRFPSHYLLPQSMRARFIKSEFTGLLPGAFSEIPAAEGFGLYPGTWLVPSGMNDENREDISKYTELKHCDFLVDSRLPSTTPTAHEPSFLTDTEKWDRVKCLPFLDTVNTGAVGRLGWLPNLPFMPDSYRRVWGEQCLLKKRKMQTASTRLNPIPVIETLG